MHDTFLKTIKVIRDNGRNVVTDIQARTLLLHAQRVDMLTVRAERAAYLFTKELEAVNAAAPIAYKQKS